MTNELRIFISSTFRDLGEEREHILSWQLHTWISVA
ncbi:MAG: DUF4062 domain-containing protein [Candidatus Kapaibacterium sp.]